MSFLLPSDMGRLIYGYLQSSCSEELAEEFLNTSDSMKECRKYKHIGFNPRVHDRTLTQMLTEYSLLSDLIFEQCNENERSHFNVVSTLQNLLKSKVSCPRIFAPTDVSITEPPCLENSPLHEKHSGISFPLDYTPRKSVIDGTDNVPTSNDSSKECKKNQMKKDQPNAKNSEVPSIKRKNKIKEGTACKKPRKLAETKRNHVEEIITNTSKQVPNNSARLSQVIPEREDGQDKAPQENHIQESQKSDADVSITSNPSPTDMIFEQSNENESTIQNSSKFKVSCPRKLASKHSSISESPPLENSPLYQKYKSCSRSLASTNASISESPRLENSPIHQKHSGEPLPWDYCLRKSIIDSADVSTKNDSSKECKKNRTKKVEPDEKNPKIRSNKSKNEKKRMDCKKQRKLEELKKSAEKKGHVEGKITNTSKQVPNNNASLAETTKDYVEGKITNTSKQVPNNNASLAETTKDHVEGKITNTSKQVPNNNASLAETTKDHVEGKITNTSKQVPNNNASSAETTKDHVEGKITNNSKQVPNNSASLSQIIPERKVEHSQPVTDKILNKSPQENPILESQKPDTVVSITNNNAVEEERVYDVPRKLTEEFVLFYRIGRN